MSQTSHEKGPRAIALERLYEPNPPYSDAEVRVAMCIVKHMAYSRDPNGRYSAYMSVGRIALLTGLDKRTIRKALSVLCGRPVRIAPSAAKRPRKRPKMERLMPPPLLSRIGSTAVGAPIYALVESVPSAALQSAPTREKPARRLDCLSGEEIEIAAGTRAGRLDALSEHHLATCEKCDRAYDEAYYARRRASSVVG